ncbi:MAG: hypothetical protein JSV91_09740 [Phycisphaerales bacterium]|nr:MAG: hypothetical protein JSV91_09740 [Phycisphaerales bacterium]
MRKTRWYERIDAPGPGCGYNLRGLVSRDAARCPECARHWTVEELLAQEPRNQPFRRTYLLYALAPSAIVGVCLLARAILEKAWIPQVFRPFAEGTTNLIYFALALLGSTMIFALAWGALVNVEDLMVRRQAAFGLGFLLLLANVLCIWLLIMLL